MNALPCWFSKEACFSTLFRAMIIPSQINVLQKMKIGLQRLHSMSICRQHTPAAPTVESSCVNGGETSIELSAERHNSRIRIHVAWLYRYSSKWLRGTLQATVSWNPHRRRTANMLLVFHSTEADGYDMDYTDSKSIRPRSWVCTRLVNCLWAPAFDFVFWFLTSAQFNFPPLVLRY